MSESYDNLSPLAVCAAVIQHRGKILLTQRPLDKRQGGFWEFPGGKIEPGESHHEALHRELREELAIDIEVGPLLETVHHCYDWGQVMIAAYLCRWQSGEIRHLEVADHRWLAINELNDYPILPADLPILERLQRLDKAPDFPGERLETGH